MFSALIIDDDQATVDVIRDTVDWRAFGITRVLEAYNITQAKAILDKEDADIIISDIEMPQGSGLELLEWIRERNKPGEFLLLTCHENFSYASQALHSHAADYLLKPFDADVMGLALRKIVDGLIEKRRLLEKDQWIRENRRNLQHSFWERVFRGQYSERANKLIANDAQRTGYLVVSRVTNLENDRERFGPRLLQFALENVHAEALCGAPENNSVVCMDYNKHIAVATVCAADRDEEIESRCRTLIQGLRGILSGEITCCICGKCNVENMYSIFHEALDKIAANVASYGGFFWIGDVPDEPPAQGEVLDMKKMTELLEQNRKREFLEYLKIRMEDAKASGRFTEKLLQAMREEVLQALHVDLAKNGILASRVTRDEALNTLLQKATQSALDMLRWATSAVNTSLQLKQERLSENDLRHSVDRYIEQHYTEAIGRDEIAEHFALSPGYLGKMYKKSAGISINDKLLELRLGYAKQLLANPKVSISDIAGDVGFGNQAYFSTFFKKCTGKTPNEYRKSVLGGLERNGK